MNRNIVVLTLLLLVNLINMIDRNIIASFAPQITEELALSDAAFGLLTGMLFIVSFSVAGIYMGVLADRVNRSRLLAAGLVLWSVMTAVTGIARNFLQMAIARFLFGVGEAVVTPAATTMLTDKFPPERQGAALGIYFMGLPLGVGISFLLAGVLGPMMGWRNVLIALGLAGILLAAILLLVKDPRGAADSSPATETAPAPSFADSVKAFWRALGDSPALGYMIAAIVLAHFFFAGQPFVQLWLVRDLGMEWAHIVKTYGLVSMVAGVSGSILGGVLSDWYCTRFKGGRPMFMLILTVVFVPLMLLFRVAAPGSMLFYIGMFSGFFYILAIYGPAFAAVQELSPQKIRATVIGISVFTLNVLALGMGSLVVGFGSDMLAARGIDAPLTPILIATDLMILLAVPCLVMTIRRSAQQAEA